MGLVQRLKDWLNAPPEPFRPRPPEWNKTLAQLNAENRSLSGEEIEWARSYERDQLRAWARFPRDGDEYEAVADVELSFITHWKGPFSGGGKATLPAGSRIRVSTYPHDLEPVGVYAAPQDAKAFEERWVDEADRSSPKYGGFGIFIETERLNREFRLVSN